MGRLRDSTVSYIRNGQASLTKIDIIPAMEKEIREYEQGFATKINNKWERMCKKQLKKGPTQNGIEALK